MSDLSQAPADNMDVTEQEPQTDPAALRRHRAYLLYGLFVIALFIGFAFVQFVLDHPMGESIRNLISYSMIAFFFIGSAIWALAFGPTSWSGRIALAAAFVSPLALGAAVVRDVDFSGDMKLTFRFRWDEPTSATRRATTPAPTSKGIPFEVEPTPQDYAEYRGPLRDGRVESSEADFSGEATERWRVDVGAGWAGMAVVGQLLVTMEQIGGEEAIVCFDTETGEEYWRNTYVASFDEAMGGPGPRSTPTIDGDKVFAYGAEGHLTCCDLYTGETVWQVDTLSQFSLENLTWATSGSPLVRGERVYINTGSTGDGGLTCFNRNTGDVVWRASREKWNAKGKNAAGYASPMFATISGQEILLMFDGLALRGHSIEDGQALWSHDFTNDALVNVAQPIVFDDGRVFIAASYGIGCEMLRNTWNNGQWDVQSVWKEPRLMRCKFTSPVEKDGYLYGLDEGVLECLESETGKRMWKKGRYGHGQILLAGDLILVMAEDGRFLVVKASPEGLEVVSEFPVFDAARNWNPPTVSRGRLFLRNHEQMARFDFPGTPEPVTNDNAAVQADEQQTTPKEGASE